MKQEALAYIKKRIDEITYKMDKDLANMEMFGEYVYYKTEKSYESASRRLHVLRYIYDAVSKYEE